MQNKPNFRKSQMNVNKALTKDYENVCLRRSGKTNPIQTQSNPISPKTNPKQSQFKPNFKLFAVGLFMLYQNRQ